MTDYRGLIHALVSSRVDFIIVGGAAATAHGSSRLTEDLDIVYSRHITNIQRMIKALKGLNPYLRGAPPGLPFKWDEAAISRGLNFTLSTSLGPLDLLGEITLGGSYEELLPHSVEMMVFDSKCLVVGLDRLIEVKRATGRPKDLEALAELEAMREEHKR